MHLRIFVMSMTLALLTGCATPATRDAVMEVAVSLQNTGSAPMSCRLMFGHWVDRDLGELAPGARVDFTVEQQRVDGALFVMRPDGGMRMMIETILCGQFPDWLSSVGQVDLAPARQLAATAIVASCAMPAAGGRIACAPISMVVQDQ